MVIDHNNQANIKNSNNTQVSNTSPNSQASLLLNQQQQQQLTSLLAAAAAAANSSHSNSSNPNLAHLNGLNLIGSDILDKKVS